MTLEFKEQALQTREASMQVVISAALSKPQRWPTAIRTSCAHTRVGYSSTFMVVLMCVYICAFFFSVWACVRACARLCL